MPRNPSKPPVVCQFFTWRLLQRDGVYYADGRGGKHHLGKHSLGTRDRATTLVLLRELDHQQAVERGLADAAASPRVSNVSIPDGWKHYLDFSGRSGVQGGVSLGSLKR